MIYAGHTLFFDFIYCTQYDAILFCHAFYIHSYGSKGDSDASFRTVSEGRITTPLPEYNFHATVIAPSNDVVGVTQEEECRLSDDEEEFHPKMPHDRIMKEDGVTRCTAKTTVLIISVSNGMCN